MTFNVTAFILFPMQQMDICHLALFAVLTTCSVCAVFLAQANLDGPTHDQRGGDGFFASGESLLYPFVYFLFHF